MARLKRDHSGWRSSGLYLKYQQPKVDEIVHSKKTKKNTKKWCKGNVGVRHVYQRVERTEFMTFVWSTNRCDNCGKKQVISHRTKS